MSIASSPSLRFREFRERAGLSHEQVAQPLGVSSSCVWDIESHEDELSSCYSPSQVQQFCCVLGIRPVELFGVEIIEAAISADALAQLIHEHCRSRNLSLEQFGNVVGWDLSACIEPPVKLIEDMSIDGLQWLCRELGVDWHRVILGL